jgi:hypothetical protein
MNRPSDSQKSSVQALRTKADEDSRKWEILIWSVYLFNPEVGICELLPSLSISTIIWKIAVWDFGGKSPKSSFAGNLINLEFPNGLRQFLRIS